MLLKHAVHGKEHRFFGFQSSNAAILIMAVYFTTVGKRTVLALSMWQHTSHLVGYPFFHWGSQMPYIRDYFSRLHLARNLQI